LRARKPTTFIFNQQWRTAEKCMEIFRRFAATRGNLARGDGVIEIHEHFAEVEDDGGGHREND